MSTRNHVYPLFVLSIATLACLGCASKDPSKSGLLRSEEGTEAPRVLLAPMNFNQQVPEFLEYGMPVLAEEIEVQLQKRGARVLRPTFTEFHDLWRASAKGVGSLYDSDDQVSEKRVQSAMTALVASLNDVVVFDAAVFPYLMLRIAELHGQAGVWDGSREKLRVVGRPDDLYLENQGLETQATSLRVLVISRDGRVLLDEIRGLELVYQILMKDGRWRWEQRNDLFEDRGDLRKEIRRVLRPLFPS